MVRALILDKKNQTPAPVKAVEQSCVTCGGGHSYQNCPATDGNIYRDNIQEYVSQAAAANFNQGNTGYRPQMVANQIRPPGFPPIQSHQGNNQNNFNRGNNYNQNRGNNFNQNQIYRPQVNQPPAYQAPVPQTHGVSKTDFDNYVKANDAVLRNMQNQGQTLQNQMANLTDMLSKFVTSNTTSTSGSGTLPGNTITNSKEDRKDHHAEVVLHIRTHDSFYVNFLLRKLFTTGYWEELKVIEAKTVKSSFDEPPEVELKDLPPHLEYAFLEGDDKLPVIIVKDLKDEENVAHNKSVALRDDNTPWFADFTNYHAGNFIVKGMSSQQKNSFKMSYITLDDLIHQDLVQTQVIRRCVSGQEAFDILKACHSGPTGGHYGANYTAKKIFNSDLLAHYLQKECHDLSPECDI
ncbi:hypothetical protein Tco_1017010 [Tanacetum coccineum]|uniref:Reverse transcriptase domain-containing protein n=1 Tax=Tanacetum coccineum TaxID=301880 RepID=A0ABQ5FQH3_9ASTR